MRKLSSSLGETAGYKDEPGQRPPRDQVVAGPWHTLCMMGIRQSREDKGLAV